jgi:RHH-type transcriptional regulator, proline utilization regulon repressor / proline dehydrogenase / delta 1-pyrroline-5-carboxylate dehydrogenase
MSNVASPYPTTPARRAPDAGLFTDFGADVGPRPPLRAAIDSAHRLPEPECVPPLIEAAGLEASIRAEAQGLARRLIEKLRARPNPGLVQGLMREYALSSQEGVALMCLAEALLRVPDSATRDALIADKIGKGEWRHHLGHSPSPFVNAATWGLLITGKLVGTFDEAGLSAALTKLIARSGAPIIRASVDTAMRLMGEQFVCGETIEEALDNARRAEASGFRYSYDMLGEAAATAADATRYFEAYAAALHAIGAASNRRGIYDGPGLSIKLSALHPRYSRSQRERLRVELAPRLKQLVLLAKDYDVGVNIDAEESERLDLSLDFLEALCLDPDFSGWNGVGFVVQAYQKRAPAVLSFIVDLARRTKRRIMLRLVKGAYWDSEIKRAQVEGLAGFPVFTRKIYTDVSYIACARLLLSAPDAIYPQFATHNALTLATIYAMAGRNFYAGQYEFQCLHGMGEPLYAEVVGPERLNRPCRIYAPVGSHDTLLAYLVRRLLENGANTSFVNRIADASVPIEALLEDPVETCRAIVPIGAPHPKIVLPGDLFAPERANSVGVDFANEGRLGSLSLGLQSSLRKDWRAGAVNGHVQPALNPADCRDRVGEAVYASQSDVETAVAAAAEAWPAWRAKAPAARAACLERTSAEFEARIDELAGLICREAGKALPNAIGDIREAVDFLRYYAARVKTDFANETHRPLGVVACISPWNFPLAIFTGQIAAALAAGNAVVAKPAEETPLIAAAAVDVLHRAGVPRGALALLVGEGDVGAALTRHPEIAGVVFTGSTEVARHIQGALARRLGRDGAPIPLIAETGGQNALIVDSSALAEQVVADVLASAFDSAGQRCSALRILCLQEDIADRMIAMLKAAMAELRVGRPDRLATDVGPVITAEAQRNLAGHIAAMRERGFPIYSVPLGEDCAHGLFVPPTLIEIESVTDLTREVFGPVLHVVRYRRDELQRLIAAVNASGYALTGGAHSRIDATISLVSDTIAAGNVYINRNIIGAVVGSQPFGGHGLSGTGPKAGGPLYVKRLLSAAPPLWPPAPAATLPQAARDLIEWLASAGWAELARRCQAATPCSRVGAEFELPGPVGEENIYRLRPRGLVLCSVETQEAAILAFFSALVTGNRAALGGRAGPALFQALPDALRRQATMDEEAGPVDAVLTDAEGEELLRLLQETAARTGPLISVYALAPRRLAEGELWPLDFLASEQSIAINTTAAGGNASLMSIG